MTLANHPSNDKTHSEEPDRSLRRMMEQCQDLIYRYEFVPQRRFAFVNQACVAITGYTPEEHYADPDLGIKLVHPDDRSVLEDFAHALNETGQPVILRWIHRDGHVVWTEQKNVPIYDEAGQLIAIEGVARDVTERKTMEAGLRESEARYRLMFDSNPQPMWAYDLQTLRFLAVNDAAIAKYGYSRDEFLRMTIADIRLPEDTLSLLENVLQISAGFENAGTGRHLRKDGSLISVEITSHTIEFEGHQAELVCASDVTQQKQLQEERQYLFEYSPDLLAIAGFDGYFKQLNPAWEQLLGWTVAELASKPFVEFIHPDDRQQTQSIAASLGDGNFVYTFQNRYQCRDGSYKWISWNAYGSVEQKLIFSAAHDVTAEKQAQEQLNRRLTDLEALYESGLAFGQILDARKIGEKLVDVLSDQLHWHHAAVHVRRGTSDELDLLACSRSEAEGDEIRLRSIVTRVGESMTGRVIQHGEIIRRGDIISDPQYKPSFDGMRSDIYVPIKIHNQTIGCISAASEQENAFSADDERLLSTLSAQAAAALENARLFQEREIELSERKRIQLSLAESEARYRSLLDQLPAMVYLDDATVYPSVTHFVSPRVQDILGYTVEEWLQGGYELWTSSIHPEDRVRVVDNYEASIKNGAGYQQTYRMMHRNGSWVWVHDSATVQKNERNESVSLQGLMYDITDSKKTEETLRTQSAALEAADNAMFITDMNGVLQWLNSAYSRLTGFTVEEAVGQLPHVRYSDIYDEAFYRGVHDTIFAGKVWHGELINNRKNGSLYFEEQTITPLTDRAGNITNFIGIKQDISSRKKAEQQIHEQLERLTALHEIEQAIGSSFEMEVSLDVLLRKSIELLDVDAALVILFNPMTNTLDYAVGLGFRTTELESSSVQVQDSFAGIALVEHRTVQIPDLDELAPNRFSTGFLQQEGFRAYYNAPLMIKGQAIGVLEVFKRTPAHYDSAWLDFLNTLAGQAAIAVDNAQLFSALQQELAAHKLTGEALQKSHAVLEQRVNERTSDLSAANTNLARALRVKDEFLSNMSHELRTPLNAILGLSESLGEQLARSLSKQHERYLRIIHESGHHLLNVINDILDLSKIEADKFELSMSRVNLHEVCQASIRMVKEMSDKKMQSLDFHFDSRIGGIEADERRLKQMIVNLLSNAVKFTPEKGMISLDVQADPVAHQVSIVVIDNGIGIAEKELQQLFRPFVQVDNSMTRGYSGTGLGLVLVQKMARMHGGDVSASSTPGQGSCFTITLPWSSGVTVPLPPAELPRQPLPKVKPARILLVDDTEAVIVLVRDYLESVGYIVLPARSGAEALVLAQRVQPDLILMDIQMPDMDGLSTTRLLRNNALFKNTPIIALTALAMEGDRERCLAAGMNDYISKPIGLHDLVQHIEEQLRNTLRDSTTAGYISRV